jgi:hypothetical protein
LLRAIEHRIESLFEGVFGRAFRSHVQPVELARKLVKEMDDHRTVSVSRVYVPNEYHLYLSPKDREQFRGLEASLLSELGEYLAEHARREGYSLPSPPRVVLEEDEDLSLGEFGIATRLVQPPSERATRVAQAAPVPRSETRVLEPQAVTEIVPPEEAAEAVPDALRAALVVAGTRHELDGRVLLLGRSRECDIAIDDPSISRRHAELRPESGRYEVVDLGSTNGVEVNGARVKRTKLADGDCILLGQTELRFEQT